MMRALARRALSDRLPKQVLEETRAGLTGGRLARRPDGSAQRGR